MKITEVGRTSSTCFARQAAPINNIARDLPIIIPKISPNCPYPRRPARSASELTTRPNQSVSLSLSGFEADVYAREKSSLLSPSLASKEDENAPDSLDSNQSVSQDWLSGRERPA